MPTRERVQAFVAMVEANKFVEAIREFYTDDATMQENLGDVRAGLDALVAGEEAALRRVTVDHHAAGLDLRDRRRPRDRALGVRHRAGRTASASRSTNSPTRPGAATASRRSASITIRRSASRREPRKKTNEAPRLRVTEISRAIIPARCFIAFFFARVRSSLALEIKFNHKPAPFARPCVRVRNARLARAALRFRVPLIEGEAVAQWLSTGLKPGGRRFNSCRFHQTRIAQWVEQMTCNHPVAGSNPAPALRFSLKS